MSETNNKLEVGDIAPDFTAYLPDGNYFNLYTELQAGSPILLVFYPGDDTPGCTKQLCGIRDVWSDFQNHNVRVFGINHANADSHNQFKNKYNFPFDIIVDENKEIANKYGAQKMFFKYLVIKRGVFLINTDKKIVYRFWGQQDNQKVLDVAKNL